MTQSRVPIRVSIIVIICILLLSGCTTKPLESADQQEEVIPVRTDLVIQASFSETIELSGRSKSRQDLPILTPTPMTVKEVPFKVGERVNEGDVLIQFDDQQAKTQLTEARNQVKRLEQGVAEAERLQREALSAAQVAQAEGQEALDRAQAILDGAQTGAVTILDLLQASTQLLLLQNQLQLSPDALQNVNPAQLQIQLEQARGQVRLAEEALDQLTVTAPFAGVITARQIEPKGVAIPNVPLLQLSQLDQIIVELQVGSTHINQLQTGMKAFVLLEGQQQPIEATLDFLSPGVGLQGNLYQAQIILDNKEQQLYPGKLAKVEVEVDHYENALLVPVQAVFFQENKSFIYTVEENLASIREIQLGERNRSFYRVISGIEKDEQVITTGRERVTDGRRVYIQK
jgi:HlyD family secretion protein